MRLPAPEEAVGLEELWRSLLPLGYHRPSGGYRRFAWNKADLACRAWFTAQAADRGLTVRTDRNGNQWAWWGEQLPGKALAIGSHLDSVPDGGAFDGPLGVVASFAAVDLLRTVGWAPERPVVIANFADEEGARFGIACAGSRLLTGQLDPDRARELTDADGVSLAAAMEAAGQDPEALGRDEELLGRIGRYVELHIEQGRALVDLDRPIGVASSIWPHGRWRFEFGGEANHAGTTRLADRRDPMLTYAYTVLAARKKAQAHGALATFGRIQVEPNGTNAIASKVSAWLDGRAPDEATLGALLAELEEAARERAGRDGASLSVVNESLTPIVEFDHALRDRLAETLDHAPVLPTGAGHDAGILAACLPTAMLFVRNPSGVSHSPAEQAAMADCRAGVHALARAVSGLAGAPVVPGGGLVTAYLAAHAFVDGAVAADVLIETDGGVIGRVTAGAQAPAGAVRLSGFTLPGLANAHSHAFHRALRGRTQAGEGTFWTWREQMYAAVAGLDPDSYRELATGVFAEMALAGITNVGEFHYLHHAPGGRRYADENAMGHALIEAARAAGIRITLLDTCYLAGGIRTPANETQQRFSDGDAEAWAARVEALRGAYADAEDVVVGAAIHSVRAVPVDQLSTVAEAAGRWAAPLHVHLSEQRAENEACLAEYHRTPAQLLEQHGALGPRTSVVHATHLSQVDIDILGDSHTCVCMCPTTERDLADGIGAARSMFEAGSPITLGSDSHAVIDLFEEARGVELDERLSSERRGHWPAADLLRAATAAGHASLGRPGVGTLAAGQAADFATVDLDSVRLAGTDPRGAVESVVYAATSSDVRHVVVGGRVIVWEGVHRLVDDAPRRLGAAVRALYR